MLKIRKILAPVDFSEVSERAAQHAAALSRQFDSSLILAHVICWEAVKYTQARRRASTYPSFPQMKLQRRLTDCWNVWEAGFCPGRQVQRIVLEGDPAGEIVKFAHENQADLIVMPTHGYGPFRRFLLGSVTAKVLHDSNCPVFTSTHMAEPRLTDPRHYRRVSCAVDLGPHSERVLRWAADFATTCGAELEVIHAAPRVEVKGYDVAEALHSALLEAVNDDILKLMKQVGCKAVVHAESAEVTDYIPKTAAATQTDLLVVGRTTKHGIVGRLRTNTYSLIRESPCPVVGL